MAVKTLLKITITSRTFNDIPFSQELFTKGLVIDNRRVMIFSTAGAAEACRNNTGNANTLEKMLMTFQQSCVVHQNSVSSRQGWNYLLMRV